jgi:hypothetical protein
VAVLLWRSMSNGALFHYVGFMLSSVLLGLAFLSLAVLLSVLARDRTRASGLAIATWFFFRAGVRPAAAGRAGGHRRAVGAATLCLAAAAQPGRRVPHPQRVLARRRAHAVRPGQRRSPVAGQPRGAWAA